MTSVLVRLFLLELRMLLRQGATWAVLLPLTAALLVAAHLGAQRVAAHRQVAASAQGEERRIEREAKAAWVRFSRPSPLRIDFHRDPTGAYSYLTMFLVRSPLKASGPLAALAIGQSDVLPSRVRLGFGFSSIFTDEFADIGSPRMLKRGGFDIAFVLVYLLPLAIIALAATRLAGEQETGLLRMIAAQPVGIRTVAVAKFGVVGVLFVAWTLIGGGAALLVGGVLPVPTGWAASLAWLGACVAAYCLFWVILCALAVSLWRGPAVAIATAAAAWALFTILVPSAIALSIDALAPAPSRIAYIDTSRRATEHYYEHRDDLARQWARRNGLAANGTDFGTSTEIRRLSRDDMYKQVLAPHRRALDAQRERAARMADRLALLSPALLLQREMERAAGTDALRHLAFQRHVDAFDEEVRSFFRPLILNDVLHKRRPCPTCPAQLTFSDYGGVPRAGLWAEHGYPSVALREATLLLALLVAAMLLLARRRFREDHLSI